MTRYFAVLLAALVLGYGAMAEDAQPPIRDFDIQTIEKLGHAMYAQDQEAWKATDILMASHSQDELRANKAHGWIVDSFPDRDVVRFVRDGAAGPEASYDVAFPKTGVPVMTEPKDRTLNAQELAQYNARLLAMTNAGKPCAEVFNSVALKDPQGDGWLIWVMSATTSDPKLIILGRHYRFTISADGKTILRKDALSHACVQFERLQEGEFAMTQIVSNIPVETMVFASLSYTMPLNLGTRDGKAWKVAGGRIAALDMDMPGLNGFYARALAGIDETCQLVAVRDDDPSKALTRLPFKSVIGMTEGNGKFDAGLPRGQTAQAVFCLRDDLVPAPNDYKVLQAGLPLSIKDNGQGHTGILASLEMVNGQFRFRVIDGPQPSAEQFARIQARLNSLQTAFQAATPPRAASP